MAWREELGSVKLRNSSDIGSCSCSYESGFYPAVKQVSEGVSQSARDHIRPFSYLARTSGAATSRASGDRAVPDDDFAELHDHEKKGETAMLG